MADSSRLPTYKMYTIGWIAALDKELTAALAILDEIHQQPEDFEQNDKDSNAYSWGQVGGHNIVIASLSSGSYGLVSAATTATCMATSLPHLRFGLMVGIGAGVPSLEDHDVRLGDVVVSLPSDGHSGVIQYDLGKMGENGQFRRVGALSRPPEVLLKALTKLRAEQRLKDSNIPQILSKAIRDHPKLERSKGKDSAFVYQGAENDRLFEATSVHMPGKSSSQTLAGGAKRRKISDTQSCLHCDAEREIEREERPTTDPEVHYGTIASGNLVIKDGIFRDQVLERLGTDVLCYEMEAAGLMNNFPCLVIRGICDYADTHKNDRWQNYAALAAAAYAKELLGTIDARRVVLADKMQKIMTEVSDTKQAVQSLNDEQLLDKMYAWLSAPDPSVNYQTALSQRHTGTCEWFLLSEQYERWKMQSTSSLWIYGSPGCGKTILSSVIISDLKAFEDDTQHLLFFFFSFTDSKKQSLDGVVRSLTNQLSRKSTSARAYLTSTFSSKYEKSLEQPSTAELCEIFECMIQRSNDIWVVLDALDECQLGSTFTNEGLLSWLQSLLALKHDNIRTLVTSRREHNIRVALEGCIVEQLCLQGDLVAGDIQAFIDETITNWDGLSIWQEHKWVQEEIRDYLTKNSDGMFRWVSCQLDALAPLQGCRDHEALLATLESLPKSLDGIYARILSQIPEALRVKANRILQFLLYTETPLYVEEVVEIAVFSPKSERSMKGASNSIKPEKDAVLLYCPNLVECVVVTGNISEVSREVLQLAHCSVRDFLLSDRLERSTSSIFESRFASGSMTEVCLSYLLNIDHNQPLDHILSSYPLASYAACFWIDYAKRADTSMILDHIREFIHCQDHYKTHRRLLLYTERKRSNWFPNGAQWLRAKRQYGGSLYDSMLEHFAMRGLVCAVEEILHKDADALDTDGAYFGTSLLTAAYAGHKEVICLLLGAGANPNAQGGSALQVASGKGYQEIVQLLLNAGANPNAQWGEDGSALQAASRERHQKIVRLLLNKGANPNAQGGEDGSALQAASREGHQEIVRLLLNKGANPNSKVGSHSSPLTAAVQRKQKEVIHMLLDAGADPNVCVEGNSSNALHTAAYQGNTEIMQMLLDAGADPNASSGKHGNSLTAAVAGTHSDAVELLLEWKANINDHHVFYTAAVQPCTNIIKLLLCKGAPVGEEAPRAVFETGRDQALIEQLLESFMQTASIKNRIGVELSIACLNDHHDYVQTLLDAGANVNLPMLSGDTALYIAASRGLKSMFELLLDKASAVSQSDYIPDGSFYDTSIADCTNLEHLLSMQLADAKRLLGKALACSASSGSRDDVRRLAETCQTYHQESGKKREILEEVLARAMQRVKKGCDKLARLLLDQGADPNVRVSDDRRHMGEPSLCYLMRTNNVEDKETFRALVELLLDRGADATKIQGTYGCALDTALRERRWDLVGMLRGKGVGKTPLYRFMEAKVDRELLRLQEEHVQD